jgi:hypothetical protein
MAYAAGGSSAEEERRLASRVLDRTANPRQSPDERIAGDYFLAWPSVPETIGRELSASDESATGRTLRGPGVHELGSGGNWRL